MGRIAAMRLRPGGDVADADRQLHHFEQRHLKAAFGVIRSAQGAIALRYPVREMT